MPEPDYLRSAIREAAAAGVRLLARGSGQWWPGLPDGARPLESGAAHMRIDSGDLVATVGAGVTLAALDAALTGHGAWLALDPPGPRTRTLGGTLACGGHGPLATGYGAPRDQVLGLAFVTGSAERVKTGGRVVKNVAGFDLAKLLVGSHGAFGLIVEAHLRLRMRPASDLSATWSGSADSMAIVTASLMNDGVTPVSFEVVNPALARGLGLAESWTLCLRSHGSEIAVEEELAACERSTPLVRHAPPGCWDSWREQVGAWPVMLRIGADPSSWLDAVRIAEQHAGAPLGASVTVPRGTVRIGYGSGDPAAIARLRAAAAQRGWPVTLERADAATLGSCGVWGSLSPQTLALTQRLKQAYDPGSVFATPLVGAGR